ncbi:hypothetical protein THRCLA_22891 [Thraustotheca clavata]|uniref:Uncharacterized protein n=1 Tax=Thraustotheca clavata TaxID=74557 RepID=A0A1V9YRA7_9STRA|nr:hypothetical protein THRCLA_22891 [Thraustotheca clavata]
MEKRYVPNDSSSSSSSSLDLYEREELLDELTDLVEKEELIQSLLDKQPLTSSASSSDGNEESTVYESQITLPKQPLPPSPKRIQNHWDLFKISADMSPFRDVVNLCVSYQKLRNSNLALLVHNITSFLALRSIDISNNQLDDCSCKDLLTLLVSKHPPLLGINISNNLYHVQAFNLICESLHSNTSLRWLIMYGNPMTYSPLQCSSLRDALYVNETLEALEISLTDFESPFENTTKLNLAFEFLSGLGFHSKHLNEARFGATPELKQLHLTSLSLAYAEISKKTIVALMPVLHQQPQLTALDLSYCFIGIDGARAIASSMLKLPMSLITLNLKCNHIGDIGAIAIVSSIQDNMTALYLQRNEVSNEGIIAISKNLPSLRTLTQLDLTKNNIGKSGFLALINGVNESRSLTSLGQFQKTSEFINEISLLESALTKNAHEMLCESTHIIQSKLVGNSAQSMQYYNINTWVILWGNTIQMDARMCLTWSFGVDHLSKPNHLVIEGIDYQLILYRSCAMHEDIKEVLDEEFIPWNSKTIHQHAITIAANISDRIEIQYQVVAQEMKDVKVGLYISNIYEEYHHIDEKHLYYKALEAKDIEFSEVEFCHKSDFYHTRQSSPVVITIYDEGSFRLLFDLQIISHVPINDLYDPQHVKLKLCRVKSLSTFFPKKTIGGFEEFYGVYKKQQLFRFSIASHGWSTGDVLSLEISTSHQDITIEISNTRLVYELKQYDTKTLEYTAIPEGIEFA